MVLDTPNYSVLFDYIIGKWGAVIWYIHSVTYWNISNSCTWTHAICTTLIYKFFATQKTCGLLTDADKWVEKIWNGREHDVMCVSTKIPSHVCRQPLHDDVVGPVHAEVRDIYWPQWPVTDEFSPPRTAVGDLCNIKGQHYSSLQTNIYKNQIFMNDNIYEYITWLIKHLKLLINQIKLTSD